MHRRPSAWRTLAATTAAVVAAAAAALVSGLATQPAAASNAQSVGDDYCLGECADILPPGQNGNATLAEILAHRALGTRPGHSSDQLDRYVNLVYNYSGLTGDQISHFFNDASFGVPPGVVERTDRPRADVTIVRDKATGVPHITGTTRAGTMFGAGYAGAQDRLFVMDLMRNLGRGQLTSFAGGGAGNQALEQSLWHTAPYTEADLQAQVDRLRAQGQRGAQVYDDVSNYIAGINRYIADCMAARNCPGEYVLTGHLDAITNAGGPKPFTMTDLIGVGGVIGGIFGGGGGAEMQSALVRLAARARYGTAEGDRVWAGFRNQNDPEAVLTLHNGQSFPYGDAPPNAASVALPDAGTARAEPLVYDQTGTAVRTEAATSPPRGALAGLKTGMGMSNAVVVSAAKSTTGHPIAVFGPQTGYFAPQLLMLQELRGPGIASRGVAFAGLNLYVLLGRGSDYAWSATSAAHDITDTFTVPLCEPDGREPTIDSRHYRYRDQCLPMEVLEKRNAWKSTLADPTPDGSYRLVSLRTRYGLVAWRGLVAGRPVAFTNLRSTYRHEADSAIGFMMFNDPAQMGSAAAFHDAAANVGFAFNWFYVNSRDAAYFNSGLNPVRAPGTDPNLPVRAEPAFEWQNWDPVANTARYHPGSQQPHGLNQDYYVSWNNKQAKDFSAADGNFSFGALHRANLLDAPMRAALAGDARLDAAGTLRIVQQAGVTDLRGKEVLGDLLRLIERAPVTDPAQADAVAKLKAWYDAGARRVETAPRSKRYEHEDAIQIFDAWWPLLVSGQFKAGLGDELYRTLAGAMQINESPSGGQNGDAAPRQPQAHKGSAFQFGWWGYVDKDIRAVLGEPVQGPLPRRYCGGGDAAACRQMLLTTLAAANAQPLFEVYPGDDVCAPSDQWCADAIVHSPLGGITHAPTAWQNRPTYQQVVSFPAGRGDDVTNMALGRPVQASGAQAGHPTRNAVDGDHATRWGSSWNDGQWISVDLGSVRRVSRVLLRWEAAYGRAYRIEVSADGSTWRPVWSTAAGNGSVDNNTFAPVSARYVRVMGLKRATSYGYSLYELGVYQH